MADKWSLHDQIRHNKRATVWLFVWLFIILWLLIMAIGYALGVTPWVVAPFALIIGLLYLLLSSGVAIPVILKSARARPADPKKRAEKLLIYRVEEMAIAAGMPRPKVYVTPSKDINAFATGKTPEKGVIAVTEGALEKLDQEELEGVIAHEMSHIRNYDIRVQTYAVALIGLIAMLSEMIIRGMFYGGGPKGGGGKNGGAAALVMIVIAIALIILAPLISRLVYLAISRKREYLADASGAALTRNPEGLARALRKIGGEEPAENHKGDRTVASLYFANPLRRVRVDSMWSTHPPIDMRVERLKAM